jgi:hypothetical protein
MANVALHGGARLEGAYDGVDRTVYTTTAFAPTTANTLMTFCVFGYHSTGGVVQPPTVAGGGVTTWTEETAARTALHANAGGLYLFRALQSSWGASAAATITFPSGVEGCGWCVCEWDNADTSGTNGSGALRQVDTNEVNPGTSIGTTLAALNSAESMAAGWAVAIGSSITITVGSGYTSAMGFNNQAGPPSCSLRFEWKLNATDPNVTLTSAPVGMIGFEIAAAAAALTPPYVSVSIA